MLKKRIIPTLLVDHGILVRSQGFTFHQYVGKPLWQMLRYNQWSLDELIILDISKNVTEDAVKYETGIMKWFSDIAVQMRMPLTFGGHIHQLKQIENRIRSGAEKVVINKAALESSDLIKSGARAFGSQAIVVGIDVKRSSNNDYRVSVGHKIRREHANPIDYAKGMVDAGAGEIFINFVDRDGLQTGYDLEYSQLIAQSLDVPVIICGGAGSSQHVHDLLKRTEVSAAAASNMFLFKELSYQSIKDAIMQDPLIRYSEVEGL